MAYVEHLQRIYWATVSLIAVEAAKYRCNLENGGVCLEKGGGEEAYWMNPGTALVGLNSNLHG